MRVFIAYDIPKNIRELIYKNSPKFDGIKYVSPDNMHLTIKFLGEVDEDTVNKYIKKLDSIELKPLHAKLTNVGFFPSENFIRVIWIGVDADFNQRVFDLLEVSDFVPHITIGRSKRRLTPEEVKSFKSIKILDEFIINSLTIYKSTLTPEGSKYDIIKRYEL